MLTMVLVTEVPTLLPMIMGIAFFTGRLAETRLTMTDVEVEEDWTSTVTKMPTRNHNFILYCSRQTQEDKKCKIA